MASITMTNRYNRETFRMTKAERVRQPGTGATMGFNLTFERSANTGNPPTVITIYLDYNEVDRILNWQSYPELVKEQP